MKRIVSMFMAVAVVFGMGLSRSEAGETKPIAALAVASYNNLVSNVNFVGNLVERPQLGAGLEGLLAMVTQGKGLDGIDKTRTWGVVVQVSGEDNFTGYAFVPVTDFKKVLGLLRLYSTVGPEGELYKVTAHDGNSAGYVKQQGAWAFFAQKPEMLAQCAADPAALLGKLKKEYIMAGRVFLANVPERLRGKFVSQFKQGLQEAAAQHPNESSEEYANRKTTIDQLESYATRVFGELDQVLWGWGLDQTAEKVFFDVSLTAKQGTETAKEMGLAAKAATQFAGFRVPGAAITAGWAGLVPAVKQQLAVGAIVAGRGKVLGEVDRNVPENNRAAAKELVNDGASLLQKIAKSGRVDGAATVLVNSQVATGLLAGYVADGALLDKILHSIAKMIFAEHPELEQFVTLDAEKNGSINIHKISIPIPPGSEDAEKAVKLFGDKLEIIVGVGKENAYVAAGRDALATLQKAIEESARAGVKAVSPLEVSVAVKPIASLVAAVGKPHEQPQAAMVQSELQKTPGKDHVIFVVRPILNGVQAHMEVEQGLVRLVGRIAVEGGRMP